MKTNESNKKTNWDKLEFTLLSLYATYKSDSVVFPEMEQNCRISMNAISRVISALQFDVNGEKRYQIDILGNIAGYENKNRLEVKTVFLNNL